MTIKEFTDYLYEAGHGSDEINFIVRGEVEHDEEIQSGMRSGDYTFTAEVDSKCEVYDAIMEKGKVTLILEIVA